MTEQVETTESQIRTDGINLSDTAASKVKSLLEQEGRADLALRIAVQPGGCSGLRYQLSSTSGPSTATSSPTSTAWPWSSTG